jgi:signal transduction histidine kinase
MVSAAPETLLDKASDNGILIVDDDPVVVQSLGKSLASVARLRFAMRGDVALRLMKEAVPDLVLLDANMPGMSGFDVMDAMAADPALAGVPVIMITGDAGDRQERAVLEKGAVDFIAKPLNPGVVLARVHTQLRLSRANAALKTVSAVDRLNLAAALTDLRESHAALQKTATELAEANQSLLQFVRIASHDLREPLNTIDQFSGLIEEDFGEQLPGPEKNYLRLVRRASTRMRTLLDDVVDYARLEVGSSDQRVPVPLNALLDELKDALAGRIAETQASLVVGHLPTVMGQPSLLALVFQNLLDNSLKFVTEGRPPNIEVSATETDGRAVVLFRDNGIGIAFQDQAKVFEPFVRLNRKQDFDGTGLGLTIARRIVEAHGGSLRVITDPAAATGTLFQLLLPLR